MVDSSCIFCEIVAGRIGSTRIYEDEAVFSFLDVGPLSDGHTLVIPKRHFEKLHDCPSDVLAAMSSAVGKVAKAVSEAIDCDGYNVLCNTGRAAGQLVEHAHFHIIPRSDSDGVFNRWPAYEYETGTAEAIAKKICAKL